MILRCSFAFLSPFQMDLKSTYKLLEDLKLLRRMKEFSKRGLILAVFTLCAITLRIMVTNGGPNEKIFHRYTIIN